MRSARRSRSSRCRARSPCPRGRCSCSRGPRTACSTSRSCATELGYRDVVPAREALARTARWLDAHPLERGGTEEKILQDPFDYAAEDALVAGWRRALAAVPAVEWKRAPGYTASYSGPGRHPALGRVRVRALARSGALLALAGCAWFPPLPTPRLSGEWATHAIAADQITEASGLALSHRSPKLLWTHNDSGDRARLFLLRPGRRARRGVRGRRRARGRLGGHRSRRRGAPLRRRHRQQPERPARSARVPPGRAGPGRAVASAARGAHLAVPLRRPVGVPRPGARVRRARRCTSPTARCGS